MGTIVLEEGLTQQEIDDLKKAAEEGDIYYDTDLTDDEKTAFLGVNSAAGTHSRAEKLNTHDDIDDSAVDPLFVVNLAAEQEALHRLQRAHDQVTHTAASKQLRAVLHTQEQLHRNIRILSGHRFTDTAFENDYTDLYVLPKIEDEKEDDKE